jgi:hypothetical protein
VTSGASIDQRFCEYKRGHDKITTERRIFSAPWEKHLFFQDFSHDVRRINMECTAGDGAKDGGGGSAFRPMRKRGASPAFCPSPLGGTFHRGLSLPRRIRQKINGV